MDPKRKSSADGCWLRKSFQYPLTDPRQFDSLRYRPGTSESDVS